MKISPKWLITGEGDMIEHEAAESATNGLKTTENEDTVKKIAKSFNIERTCKEKWKIFPCIQIT